MPARKKGNATGNTDMTAGIGGKLLSRNEEVAQEKPKKKTKLIPVPGPTPVKMFKEVEVDEPETGPENPQNELETEQAIETPIEPKAVSTSSKTALDDAPSSRAIPQPKSLNVNDRGLLSKKDNRSHRISIFVTEDRYNTLQALKKSTGVSVNSMINSAIDQLIEDNREYLAEQ